MRDQSARDPGGGPKQGEGEEKKHNPSLPIYLSLTASSHCPKPTGSHWGSRAQTQAQDGGSGEGDGKWNTVGIVFKAILEVFPEFVGKVSHWRHMMGKFMIRTLPLKRLSCHDIKN